MSTIAVTGAAGYIGQHLLDQLAADPDVERVLALDVRRFEHPSPKITSIEHDVRVTRSISATYRSPSSAQSTPPPYNVRSERPESATVCAGRSTWRTY